MSDTMDRTIEWLRGLAAKGGKGVVNNVDARCLGRIADDLAQLRHGPPAIDALTAEREEYRTRWLGSVTPEEGRRLRAQIEQLLAVLKEIDSTWPVATSELRERVRKVIADAEPASAGQSEDKR